MTATREEAEALVRDLDALPVDGRRSDYVAAAERALAAAEARGRAAGQREMQERAIGVAREMERQAVADMIALLPVIPSAAATATFRVGEVEADIHTNGHTALYREDQKAEMSFSPGLVFEVLGDRPKHGTRIKITAEIVDDEARGISRPVTP